jgi:hypothetical protein
MKGGATLAFAGVLLGIAACGDAFDIPTFANDAVIEADMAASAGDAIASAIADMAANEAQAGLQAITSGAPYSTAAAIEPTYSRSRTCYDGSDAVVTNCAPLSQVRRIVTHVTFDGTRQGSSTSGEVVSTWVANIHLIADDTTRRIFTAAQSPVETARNHSALITARDTMTFTQGEFTRHVAAASDDSVQAVTWNLPHSQNPFPVSGKIIRMLNWKVTASGENRTLTRDVSRRVQVVFPADAQGNVVLTINDLTCNLNLVTRIVSNCE